MKKRTLVILGIVLAVTALGVFLLGLALAPFLRQPRAEFDRPGILVVDLSGLVVEREPTDLFSAQLLGAQHELLDLSLALDRAITDDDIAGVYLRVGWPGYGWAKAEEIRGRLQALREAGKFVHAYTSFTNERGYYVALAADLIYLLPDAGMELNGFKVESPFIRQMMEKMGIEPQVEAIGEYKSGADMFRRDDMSPEDEEATRAILDLVYDRFVAAVVESREVDRERFVEAFDRGIYLGRDLEALGLIDGEMHESAVLRGALAEALDAEVEEVDVGHVDLHLIDVRDYARQMPDPPGSIGGTIALVYATGTITGGESGFDPLFGQTMGARTMVRMLRDVAADEEVDAVVLRVDSPGGDALASEEIWAAVGELRQIVPVVVSMSDVAASGGYYIAAGADSILAEATTITGSIGVFAVLLNLREMWGKLGVTWDQAATNEGADFPPFNRSMTEEERETFRGLIEHTYQAFLQRVSAGRDMPVPSVDAVARGRVWTGAAAEERNLVDGLGGLESALAAAKSLAGIDPDDRVRLHVYPGEPTLIERLREAFRLQMAPARVEAGGLGSPLVGGRARELLRLLPGAGLVFRDGPGRPMTVMPWVVEIR
ncbi:MAG TPA: signal peptide peptidase SppA [Gemmatimonadota bacterium]|nr:signal peptide peptidase SppA [Gemmatimonadota bacterium]